MRQPDLHLLGHPAGVMGMELAAKKALSMGVGVVSVFNSHHFGATGYYAALAPKQGLIGLVTSSGRVVSVVPTRGTMPVLVAGDPEALSRELRLREGIPIPRKLADKIRAVCQRCGVPFVLE